MTLETGAIMSLSKRSSCSVHQGTKVSSAEECNQDTFTPRRVRPESAILSQAELVSHQPRKGTVSPASQRHSPQAELAYCQP